MMTTETDFRAHIRAMERLHNAGCTTSYCARNDRNAWIIAGRIYGYTFGKLGESRAYQRLDGTLRHVFDDGTYSVIVGRATVNIEQANGARFSVPRGHAYFDRIAEATTRMEVQALHAELVEALS